MIFFLCVQNRKYSLYSPLDTSITSKTECQNILVKMHNVKDSASLLLCWSSMEPKNNGTGMNSSGPSLFYLSTALFLALIYLIDSNIDSGKEYMGIINDKQWKLLVSF